MTTTWKRAVPLAAMLSLFSSVASADDTIKQPGEHPNYHAEIEPHFLFGLFNSWYGANSYGLGARVSFPIVKNGFVPSINNSVAIGVGLDFVHYSGCYAFNARFYNYYCDETYTFIPVVMQWNFYVAQRWSVFGEPGLYIFHGFFNNDCPPGTNCGDPRFNGVDFAFFAGGRYHFNESLALTMRIGYPTFSIGLSFFP